MTFMLNKQTFLSIWILNPTNAGPNFFARLICTCICIDHVKSVPPVAT